MQGYSWVTHRCKVRCFQRKALCLGAYKVKTDVRRFTHYWRDVHSLIKLRAKSTPRILKNITSWVAIQYLWHFIRAQIYFESYCRKLSVTMRMTWRSPQSRAAPAALFPPWLRCVLACSNLLSSVYNRWELSFFILNNLTERTSSLHK